MKGPLLLVASMVMLLFAGVSFNWEGSDRPILIEALGILGIFVWIPLLIAGLIASFRKKADKS